MRSDGGVELHGFEIGLAEVAGPKVNARDCDQGWGPSQFLLQPLDLTDTVEKVPKYLLAISSKETKLSYARQLIWHPGRCRSHL
jgi:hypothetical protein